MDWLLEHSTGLREAVIDSSSGGGTGAGTGSGASVPSDPPSPGATPATPAATPSTPATPATPAAPAAPVTPTPPVGRTYTDSDVATIRRNEEARARRLVEQETARIRAEYESRQAPQEPIDPFEERLSPLQKQVRTLALDNAINNAYARHPELKENLTDVLDIAVQLYKKYPAMGEDFNELIDVAYDRWDRPRARAKVDELSALDIEKIKEQARVEGRDAYIAGKTGKADAAITPSGGGGTATTPTKKIKSKQDMEDAVEAILNR